MSANVAPLIHGVKLGIRMQRDIQIPQLVWPIVRHLELNELYRTVALLRTFDDTFCANHDKEWIF